MAISLLLWLAAATAAPTAASLVGTYDGNQMEMAVGLKLSADGRFEYGMAYGALDEEATGKWEVRGDKVLLTSDPVTAPRFTFLGQKPAPAGMLRITLEVPRGMTAQLFDGMYLTAKGKGDGGQLSDDEPKSWPIDKADPPVRAAVALPMFELASEPVVIDPAKGYWLQFRFEPNDLGKVDFRATPLTIEGGDLLLDRHDRHIRFRRTAAQ
jgi:hypothetical protein